MKLNSIVIKLALIMAVVAAASLACSSDAKQITASDLNYTLVRERVMIVDARDRSLFDAQHINAGIVISAADMSEKLANVPKEELIVTYGAGPDDKSAQLVARVLAGRGHKRVFVLEGGLPAWIAAGLTTRSKADIEKFSTRDLILKEKFKQPPPLPKIDPSMFRNRNAN